MIDVSENVLNYLNTLYGEKSAKNYIDFIKQEPVQYLRVNKLKETPDNLSENLFSTYNIKTEKTVLPYGLKMIDGRNIVSKTIEHIIGKFYIQGLSSMIPPLILNPQENEKVLDLCSAPGSKTTELGELMNNRGILIANEVQLDRVKMLVYNIDRMNIINAGAVQYKGEWLSKIYSEYFDKILIDAPCSGLGIIQKKGEINNWWSLERTRGLGELQTKLLVAGIKMLKTGGELVYSTCTLSVEENELVLNKILKKYPVEVLESELPVKSHEAFTSYKDEELNPALSKASRILPWEVNSDGFFIIKLRKISETKSPEKIKLNSFDLKLLNYKNKEIRNYFKYLTDDFGIDETVFSDFQFLMKKNDIFFVSREWNDNNPGLFERIGTRFGIIDKNNRIILHTQAAQIFDKNINKNIYKIEDQNELKIYLEGGIIKKETGFRGQCVIKYNNDLLGTAVITDGGIKSRFPRAKRTQEIITEF